MRSDIPEPLRVYSSGRGNIYDHPPSPGRLQRGLRLPVVGVGMEHGLDQLSGMPVPGYYPGRDNGRGVRLRAVRLDDDHHLVHDQHDFDPATV